MRLEVHAFEPGLSGDGDERRAVELRVGDAGEQVRRPWPQRREADAREGRETSVDVGHERRGLFVTREDELDLVAVLERRIEVERLFAGDPEHVPHALVLEAANEQLRGVHLGDPFIVRRARRPVKTVFRTRSDA